MNIHKHIITTIIFVVTFSLIMFSNCYEFGSEEKLNTNLLWSDTFESLDMRGWKVIDEVDKEESNWFIDKGYLVQDTDCGNSKSLLGTNIINEDKKFGDCVLRANLVCTDDDYIGVLFRYNNIDNYYRFLLSSQRKYIGLDKKVNGDFVTLASYTEKEWQHVKFSVTIYMNGQNIKVYLNDELFFDVKDESFDKGRIGFASISNLGSFFNDISVYSDYEIKPVEKEQAIIRGPYLQNVLENHAVIMWNTQFPTNSIVEYGLSKEEIQSIEIDKEVVEHEVKLNNLKQAIEYYYRIISGEITSDWYSFKTASNNVTSFSFVAYGDSQMGFLRHAEIAEQMAKHNFEFILHMGDVVQRGPRADWDVEFFNPMKDILKSKAVYAAVGNHELDAENYCKYFSNPAPEHENYYSFEYGNCFFIIIDDAKAYNPEKEYYTDYEKGSEQYKWLESELASDKAQSAEWLFVVSHIQNYIGGKPDEFPDCKNSFMPLFEKYNVDISFSGHTHGYGRGELNGVKYIITAGGGGSQNKKGFEEKKDYKDFQLRYNFSRIDIIRNELLLKTFDNHGNLIDETKLHH